jgi:hypothetical protein
MATYKKIASADQKNIDGGYKNVVLTAPADSFLSMAKPTVFTNLGNKLEIITDHTFTAPAGFFSWLCNKHSVKITGESDAFGKMIYKSTFQLKGDSSSTQEQMENMLKDQNLIFLLKDADCVNTDQYIQLGDDCVQPDVKVTFDSADSSTGEKLYTVELTVKSKKFWYEGTVTEAA